LDELRERYFWLLEALPYADEMRDDPLKDADATLILAEMAKCRKAIAIESRKDGFPIYPDLLGH
jgi:hypothetical protein